MNWTEFKAKFFSDPTRVVALSGGGARGMAHIGVLNHLDHLALRPELVTGTSMGALVGALYCLHGSSETLGSVVQALFESELFKKLDLDDLIQDEDGVTDSFEEFSRRTRALFALSKMVRRSSVVEGDFVVDVMDHLFGDATFADLKLPFVAVATDLYTGEDVAISQGKLSTAIRASSAIPGVFPPVEMNGMLLVDGYISKNIPVPEPGQPPYRASVMVVDVQRSLRSDGPWKSGLEILARAEWIMQIQLNRFYLEMADLVLVPDVRDVHWADFSTIDELIEAGRQCARGREEEIVGLFG